LNQEYVPTDQFELTNGETLMFKVGLVGLGYWGPNLARVLGNNERCEFAACCDLDPRKLNKITRQYPSVRGYRDFGEFLESDIDAVLIATNIGTHYDLAKRALMRNKHVFVEKPLANSSDKAAELTRIGHAVGRTLMTGHTFIYSPPVIKVKELIDSGALGALRYVSVSRVNLGLYQNDVDVIWDLAVHDLSILLYWLGEYPIDAWSFGRACIHTKRDVAFLWYRFPSGVIASCEVSWLAPQKMRRTCVIGSDKMVVYDDLDPGEKIKIFERGVNLAPPSDFGEFQLTYRMGDVISPNLANVEPLAMEIDHFLKCVETGEAPITSGEFGTEVVRAIEIAIENAQVERLAVVRAA
jgi:predicted dehydrogenase